MKLIFSDQAKGGTIENIRINVRKEKIEDKTAMPTARVEEENTLDRKVESGMSKLKLAQKYKINMHQSTTERVELKELGQQVLNPKNAPIPLINGGYNHVFPICQAPVPSKT